MRSVAVKFDVGNCKVMHNGTNSSNFKYMLIRSELAETEREDILGL